MNNWLGFSLSPQEIPSSHQEDHHSQNSVHRLGFNSDELSSECFDLSSHDASAAHLNLPAPFGILEAFNRNNHHQGMKINTYFSSLNPKQIKKKLRQKQNTFILSF